MASMNFLQILLILADLVNLTSLVRANPVPFLTLVTAGTTTSTSNFDAAFGAEATKIAEEETEDGNHSEATCTDPDDCCILTFTHVSCDEHANPTCNASGCGPVPPTLGFRYAGLHNEDCVNALDDNGNLTTYNQFFISYCTRQVDSIKLYAGNNCEGSNWNHINTQACYTNDVGIGSFKLVAVPDKRDFLGGALLNESDRLSTSGYPIQGNVASVTPTDDCFDTETASYILGCKIGRSVGPQPDVPFCPRSPGPVVPANCAIKAAIKDEHPEEMLCYNTSERKWVVKCIIAPSITNCMELPGGSVHCIELDKREDANDDIECWDNVKKMWVPECFVGRSKLSFDQCIDPTTDKEIAGCKNIERGEPMCFNSSIGKCKTPRDEELIASPFPQTTSLWAAVVPLPSTHRPEASVRRHTHTRSVTKRSANSHLVAINKVTTKIPAPATAVPQTASVSF